MAPETSPEELADALVGVQRLIRRRLRREMPDPRLRGAEVESLRLVVTRPGIGSRDRLMGYGQAITMPLFLGSTPCIRRP